MNPFASATIFGYQPDEILKFLQKASPKMAEKVQKAMALGYSADEIINFLGKSFDGSTPKNKKKGPDYESAMRVMKSSEPQAMRQARAERETKEQDVLSTVLQQGLPAAAGAGVGALVGGPVGAMAGGAAGLTGVQDLMQRYQEHVNEGGQLSLQDWLKSIMKAGGAGAAVSQAPKLLAAIQAGGLLGGAEGEQQPTVEDVAAEAQAPAAAPETAAFGPEESFKAIEAKGAGNVFKSIATQVDNPGQMLLAMEKLFGKRFSKDLETEHNRPAREIVEQAWEFVRASTPGQAPTPGQPAAQEVEAEALVEAGQAPQAPTFDASVNKGHPELQKYISNIGKINTGPRGKLKKSAKELQALKSSNVRYADYDADEQKLQVLFAPSGAKKSGEIYEYFDVPPQDVEQMMKGSGTAVTTGANSFRAWFGGKNPSIGRAFHDFIKKKDDKGDAVYPYRKISEQYVKDEDLLKVRGADTVFKTTQYVEAFEDLVLKSQAKTRAEGLKMASAALKEIPDNLLEEMIFEVTKNVSGEVKQAKAKGKQKRYKGGREKEIQKRVEARAAAAKKRGGG